MNQPLLKETIDRIAEEHGASVPEFMSAIYDDAYCGRFDDVVEINHGQFPEVSPVTWEYIAEKCIAIGGASAGMAWVNKGFSVLHDYSDWAVWINDVKLKDGSTFPPKGERHDPRTNPAGWYSEENDYVHES